MKRSIGRLSLLYTLAGGMTICALFPIYWMLNTSLKPRGEIYRKDPTFWPQNPTLEAYRELLSGDFPTHLANTVTVSVTVALVSVAVSTVAAYAIARTRFRGRRILSRGVLYAYLMPRAVLFIPLYLLVSTLELANSLWGLLLIYPTITIPYATWILVPYFASVPVELEEAAMMDGCSRVGAMLRVAIPLSAPAIAATTVFSFTLCWSEYLYALVMISDSGQKTLAVGLADLIVGDVFAWGPLMGGAILASLPVAFLYLLASRYMVTGLTMGGVK